MLDSLWTRLLTVLERKLPATTLDNWVRPCRVSALNGDHLRIAAPSEAPLVGASLDRFAVRRFATDLAATYLHALRDWCELGRPPALPLPELVTASEVL